MDHMGGDEDVDLPEVDEQMMIHKTEMMKKKCQIWSKECCHFLDLEKEK